MRLWQEALVSLACLLALGCRTDPNIVLLERENRELEDTIYELQACLEKYDYNLQGCRKENAALRAKLAANKGDTEPTTPETTPQVPPRVQEPAAPSRRSTQPPTSVPSGPLKPPEIEIPSEPSPSDQLPEAFRKSPAPKPGADAPPADSTAPEEILPEPLPSPQAPGGQTPKGPSAQRKPRSNTQVAGIQINPRSTGGYNHDGRDGDDGVNVLIQPRDAQGRPCLAPAPISVVVVDPALSGDAARIARWDFTADEVAALLRDSNPGNGIPLAMLWPQAPPEHNQLQLFVRYTTDNGQKLQADCPIQVSLPSQQAHNWAPAMLPRMQSQPDGIAPEEQAQPAPLLQGPSSPQAKTARMSQRTASAANDEPARSARPAWSPNRR
jgi:hypothetical protein